MVHNHLHSLLNRIKKTTTTKNKIDSVSTVVVLRREKGYNFWLVGNKKEKDRKTERERVRKKMVGSSAATDRSKEAVGMMALHEALRSVCLNTDWTYSVFWTIRPRPYVHASLFFCFLWSVGGPHLVTFCLVCLFTLQES